MERFRKETNTKELRGFRSSPTGNLLYIARTLVVSKPSCLECHSVPDVAPKSMIQRYSPNNGFGWKLNDIVGTQMISVPSTKVLQYAHQLFVLLMAVVTVIFAATMLLVNAWLRRYVARPLSRMSVQVAEAVKFMNQSIPDWVVFKM